MILLNSSRFAALLAGFAALVSNILAQTVAGYYSTPAIHGDIVVFNAEGDLWKVPLAGGNAQRLTSHTGNELFPAISPDGKWIAFAGSYEGPQELYVMPIHGGLPTRLTFDGEGLAVRGWTSDGRILYATRHFSTLPRFQLVTIDPKTRERTILPLAEADEGAFDENGRIFFTRYSFQGSHAKRYVGGTAQNLWRLDPGAKEAVQYHPDYKGVSKSPMYWQGRVYFASERDGTANLWSMKPDGSDLKQHTRHADFGVKGPQLHHGRIVYQNGADLWLLDVKSGRHAIIPITLTSDFDQTRETWVTKPSDYTTAFTLSPDGDRVALVVRGQVFVAPAQQGRLVEITRQSGVRYRSAQFTSDGKSLIVLSDESGEVEFWKMPANGIGDREQLTSGGETLRMYGQLSPDGKWIVYTERDDDLMLYNLETKESRLVAHSKFQDFINPDLEWTSDSKWLAFVQTAESGNGQINLYNLETKQTTPVTSDRVISSDPAFSADGKWLYFLSERSFTSLTASPWGPRQPEPFLHKPTKIYLLALADQKRSPFQPTDELSAEEKKEIGKDDKKTEPAKPEVAPEEEKREPTGVAEKDKDAEKSAETSTAEKEKATAEKKKERPDLKIEIDGIMDRLWEVPVAASHYNNLTVTDKVIFVTDRDITAQGPTANRLVAIEIKNKDIETVTVASGIGTYRISGDGKKLLLHQGEHFSIVDAGARSAGDLGKSRVNLGGLRFSYAPRESWRQIFTDAWRLHRDYFYAKNMHGVDWDANLQKHLPLVDRVTTRAELNDLLNYMISELSALHTDASGGPRPDVEPSISVATLGVRWTRDESAGGYRLDYIYRSDPEFLERRGPLLQPGLGIAEGDVILEINGVATLSVPDAGALLRNQVNRQVLVKVKPAKGGEPFQRIVVPVHSSEAVNLRYTDWEYTRRLAVDEKSKGEIGYAHIRAMGTGNYYEFVRNYYSSYNKAGFILDLRGNRGGNIDSWMVSRLMRQAWMWWSTRDGYAFPHLQSPFRGHLVVLVDAWTASDGETMANAIRHLNLGKSIGVRTWGGGIWLSGSNSLVDRGIARAAEFGSFIPGEGWVIEGDGFTPDIIVDNNPASAFRGEDRQLDAAIKHLQELIAKEPKHLIPEPPPLPDKSLKKTK